MSRITSPHSVVLAVAAGLLAGCGGGGSEGPTPPTPSSIAVTLSSSTSAVTQGHAATVTVTVSRTNYTGDVALTATGLPTGVTASFDPATLTGSVFTSTLTLTAAADAAAGAGTVVVHAEGTGVTASTANLALTVTSAGSFTMAVAPSTLSMQQGTNGSATITVTRSGSMTGDVALAVTGLPTGVTSALSASTIGASATTATLTLTAASNAAAATNNITITGTSAGFPTQTATLALTVTAAPSGTSLSVSFCPTRVPTWAAYQNDGGAWTQITITNNTLTFNASGTKLGLAFVYSDTTGTDAEVMYVATADLTNVSSTARTACASVLGGKTLNGSVNGLGTSQIATIAMGSASQTAAVNGPFQLTHVADGALDLVSIRGLFDTQAFSLTPDKAIIRRGLDLATGSTIPVLDFGSSEAVAMSPSTLTIAGAGTDSTYAGASLQTATGTYSSLGAGVTTTGSIATYGPPASSLIATDLLTFSGSQLGLHASRAAVLYSKTFGAKTVTLGPVLSAATVTTAGTTPYVRMHIVLPTQTEYSSFFSASFDQSAAKKSASIIVTSGYRGSATSWDLTFPDFSAVSGWNNAWGLQAGASTDWSASAFGATYNPLLPTPPDGATAMYATQSSAAAITPNRFTPVSPFRVRIPPIGMRFQRR